MKKLINNPENVVKEMLEGFEAAYPQYIRKLDNANVIVKKDAKSEEKVALISGGGSGHEPSHGGYVGKGMLSAAVAGAVFTSPTPDQIYEAIKAVATPAGVLLVVKNYTGDIMNFEMAQEMAQIDGINVKSIIVNDDVAVENSTWTTGRRGIAGTVFVHKIAGAKAESGASLEDVEAIAGKVVSNTRSMGMALTPCIVPAAGKPNFTLPDNEMEIGMGIHGEPGTHREQLKTADEITQQLLSKILDDMTLAPGSEVAVMVNGLGATPLMELFIVNRMASQMLKSRGIKIYKTFVGEFMTSIEMAGCSLSILKLDDELKLLLDAPCDTPAFKSL